MKVLFLVTNNRLHASSRVRAYQYKPYLSQSGIQSFFVPNVSEKYYRLRRLIPYASIRSSWLLRGYGWLERLILFAWAYLLALYGPYDIVFIHKLMMPLPFFRLLQRQNKPIVFDFDDAIHLNDPLLPSKVKEHESQVFYEILQISRAVVVTSDELMQIAQPYNPNITRIPGPIDTERYKPRPNYKPVHNEEIIIGWMGSPGTVIYLEILYDVFRELTAKYPNLVISVVGSWPFKLKGVNLRCKQWNPNTEVEDLSCFDIGVMPLPDNEWTRFKGGYKLLQYMAMQIPCVTSPVGINTEIVRDGVNGYIARSRAEWCEQLSCLITNAELRGQMGRAGRRIAEEEYSLHIGSTKLINLFYSIWGKNDDR